MEKEYIKDLTEIRLIMERSTKFLSLTGWAGIMAGIYALAGVFLAYTLFDLGSEELAFNNLEAQELNGSLFKFILLALIVLILSIGTAIFLSVKKAQKKGELIWNSTARRFIMNMVIPLFTGGIIILIFISKGLLGLVLPMTLIFYGLALVNASKITFDEVRYLGLVEITLGLISSYFNEYNMLIWIFGFGIVHIIYGIYMHYKYEK